MRNSELTAFLIASCPKVAPFRLRVGVRRSEELASRGCKRTGELASNGYLRYGGIPTQLCNVFKL